jgi:sialate O-acetylesterase
MRQVTNADAEIAAASHPQIRLLRVRKSASEYPLYDAALDAGWAKCDPASVREFSAVAYYFGREVQQKEDVPIGLIESSWGGTVAEAWTSMAALSADPGLMPVFAARSRMMESERDLPVILANQKQAQEQARTEGRPVPKFPWRPSHPMWAPARLYNAMIAPLIGYPIRGVIWYQGESNSKLDRAPIYERLFETMIRDWRERWGQGDFPFLFTQISNFTSDETEDWPTIREAQRRALGLRNTAMAVTIDIGNPDNIHPTNKLDVGHRLALAARATVYGEAIEYSGPLFRQATRDGNALRVWFDHAGGLQAKGGVLKGFELAGPEGQFVPAEARIEGASVVVSNPGVESPRAVRYGWANSPECTLQNGAGLPASPFRSVEP